MAFAFIPSVVPPSRSGNPLLVVVDGQRVLVATTGQGGRLADQAEAAKVAGDRVYLGQLGPRACYAAPLLSGARLPQGTTLCPARQLFADLDEVMLALLGQAIALVEWKTMHRCCGRCAIETVPVEGERALRCPACGASFYPRISPAVIVLIERGNQLLLARNTSFPAGRFSILAGFVETGESLEDAAVREVREEVGIEIADLRYAGSQPWPFGRSLMVGFVSRHAGGEIRVDGREIVEARWFGVDELPDLPPHVSIARRLIDAFVDRVRAAGPSSAT